MKTFTLGLYSLFFLIINVNGQAMEDIRSTINHLFVATDQQDWQKVEQSFAEEVVLDYSTMTGSPAAVMSPGQIVASWQGILPGFDHTHHQTGNFIIAANGNTATAFCYGTASHYLDDEGAKIWTVIGSYHFDLVKSEDAWKISKMKFNYKYQSGHTGLPEMAINRVKSK